MLTTFNEVDMSAVMELRKKYQDDFVKKHGVTLIGHTNFPALVPTDASALYARNLLHFINLLVDPKTGELKLDRGDEIIAGALVCIDGAAATKEAART